VGTMLEQDEEVISTSTKGRLLVASPALDDGVFDRTVVYMLEHNQEGALGVVVNRPSDETDVPGLAAWETLLSPPAVVFAGGPVEEQVMIGLAVVDSRPGSGWSPITDLVGTVDLTTDPVEIAPVIDHARLFRGYAGWSPGQLDGELAIDAWIVVDALAADVFSGSPDRLWRSVLKRQTGPISWLANYPDDVDAN
jgi:putative transcriptional regulator